MKCVQIIRLCSSNVGQWPLQNLGSVVYFYISILDPPRPLSFCLMSFWEGGGIPPWLETLSADICLVSTQDNPPMWASCLSITRVWWIFVYFSGYIVISDFYYSVRLNCLRLDCCVWLEQFFDLNLPDSTNLNLTVVFDLTYLFDLTWSDLTVLESTCVFDSIAIFIWLVWIQLDII